MEKMTFSVHIHASREKIWSILFEDASYRKWTAVFTEGSHAIADNWQQGAKVQFLDAEKNGILSSIVESKPGERLAIRHLGEIRNGVEDTSSKNALRWSGITEDYVLTATGNSVDLTVKMEGPIPGEFTDYFLKVWPKALRKVKELAEE